MLDMLRLAANVAKPTIENDSRNFWVGCIGIRSDGVLVSAKNGSVMCSISSEYQVIGESHAESRTLRKAGKNCILYVSRITKDGKLAMARPCQVCQPRIRAYNVQKVYYSINETQYGIFYPQKDLDKVIGTKLCMKKH